MTTRFATSPDSTRIAFDVTGAGTPLLLLHGGGGSRAEWHEGRYVTCATSSPSSQRTCAATAKATSLPTRLSTPPKKWDKTFSPSSMPAISKVQVRLFEGMTHEQEFEDIEQVLLVILEFIKS